MESLKNTLPINEAKIATRCLGVPYFQAIGQLVLLGLKFFYHLLVTLSGCHLASAQTAIGY